MHVHSAAVTDMQARPAHDQPGAESALPVAANSTSRLERANEYMHEQPKNTTGQQALERPAPSTPVLAAPRRPQVAPANSDAGYAHEVARDDVHAPAPQE